MPSPTFHPIAIVGRAVALPGGIWSPDDLWEAVASRRDCTHSVPEGRWGLRPADALGPGPSSQPGPDPDRTWSDRGGYVTDLPERLDLSGLDLKAIGLDEAAIRASDPLLQLTLHTAARAVADAGPGAHTPARTGLIMGNLSFPSEGLARLAERIWWGDAAADAAHIPRPPPWDRFMSGIPALLAGRALQLGGPTFALDAACASALYAIKLACDALQDHTADTMLAGAVNRADDLFIHVGFCALKALSPSGRSRPFHAGADGLLAAEGAGFVMLKRLEDAVANGDTIHGVIRGIGLSNDGRGRGLLVPSRTGQARAMTNAWTAAGLDPQSLGLLECHATGTVIGDATELQSCADALGSQRTDALPIGSLKSNLGHLITAAGVAGLVKVLEAQRRGIRPPSRHEGDLNTALGDVPLRVVQTAETWTGSRRAAVNAFGFGGNNAHLIVDPYDPATSLASRAVSHAPVALVALGARVGGGGSSRAFWSTIQGTQTTPEVGTVDVSLQGLRFPPADLQQSLGQQLAVFAAARDLHDLTTTAAPERVGVIIGMGTDPEVARYGARWRVASHRSSWKLRADQVASVRDSVVPHLQSAGVLGTMPNIPANRISSQLDLGGPGFTVSAEETSGFVALDIASRMVATGELDLALAGAVDLSVDAVHTAALRALRPSASHPGDAAIVLGLQRLEDARAAGNPVLAVIGAPSDAPRFDADDPADHLLQTVGRSHCAYATVRLAQAALDLASGRIPADHLVVQVTDLVGRTHARGLTRADAVDPNTCLAGPSTRALSLPTRRLSLPTLPSNAVVAPVVAAASAPAPVRATAKAIASSLVSTAPTPLPYVEQPIVSAHTPDPSTVQTMAPAPALPAITALPAQPTPVSAPVLVAAPPAPAPRPSAPVDAGVQARVPTSTLPAPDTGSVPGRWQSAIHQMGQLHQQFMADQAALHQRFLTLRHHGATAAIQLGTAGAPTTTSATIPAPAVAAAPPVLHPPVAPPATSPAPARRAPVPAPVRATPAPTRPPSTAQPASPAATPAPAISSAPAKSGFPFTQKRLPTGMTLSREQLQVHASGKISEIYGPLFEPQDGFTRQCRMPEPPLLLADRMVGLDAEPASMGTGTIWTETDITESSWYLNDDRIPAGVLIESGQADLMLISYLGIDLQHPGDRAYRLLGCTLTYHGDLPKTGETIRYDIHVDGHAKHGNVRLFFFHYDCFTTDPSGEHGLGRPILSVRGGQAGFFTDEELADSAGILWTPEEQEIVPNPRLDTPPISLPARTFTRDEVHAFAEGRPWDCFGPQFDACRPHVWSPRFQTDRMFFMNGETTFDPSGGPWKRGYLKCVVPIEADEWYFDGHFKNDPCMPGTLMFEGCLQTMSFYLAAMGVTLKRDGWRFQPVPGEPFDLRCRGQVDPGTKVLTYEIFVEEFIAGPNPTLYADLLCTSDNLKAFHARRVGLQLVPDWPMSRLPKLVEKFPDAKVKQLLDPNFKDPVPVADAHGFPFGYHSMAACAWGKPSDAFGPMYARYDQGAHVARLPGEPYHFMTRTTRIDGEIGSFKAGNAIEIEYDVPPNVWYFGENDNPTMPFCVFLEAALQPCGWLACFVGSTLTSDEPLFFRNLDGTGVMRAEIVPTAGTFRTKVKLTNISRSGAMIIQSFDVQCLVGDTVVYDLKTVFGFFPAEALANQVGLPCTDDDFALLTEPCDTQVLDQALPLDLKGRPDAFFGNALRLPGPMLCLLDRLTGWWPEGGAKGLGRLRAEKDVDPSEWYFKAHFYTDPVQPGSLGIEALIRLLQLGCMLKGFGEGMTNPRFEPLRIGEEMSWKYRGQVTPTNKVVTSTLDIVEQGIDDIGPYLVAEGSLWVDGKRIYEVRKMGMRVEDGGPSGPSSSTDDDEPEPALAPIESTDDASTDVARGQDVILLDGNGWLADHRPTWTTPAVPMMVVADLLTHGIEGTVTGLRDVAVRGWLTVDGRRTLHRTHRSTPAGTWVHLLDSDTGDELARGMVETGAYAAAPSRWTVPQDLPTQPDPYESGDLFHGPAFQVLTDLRRGPGVAIGTLQIERSSVPVGTLAPVLLDGATHVVPHDHLRDWGAEVPADSVAYPARLTELTLYGPTPTGGTVTVIAKLDGHVGGLPRLRLQWSTPLGVWAEATLLEAPFPLGPIGTAPPASRKAFLAHRAYRPDVRLSQAVSDTSVLDIADIDRSDWLPGTVAHIYGSSTPAEIVRKEHIAHTTAIPGAGVHPGSLPGSMPLLRAEVPVSAQGDEIRAHTVDLGLDLAPVVDWWADHFGARGWPTEDLYYSLIEKFVRHVFIPSPTAFEAIRGKPALFLANHQTAVESLLFSIVASSLIGSPTVTVAKVEHKQTWVGHLIQHGFSWPGITDPGVVTYFDRADKASMMGVIAELYQGLASGTKSAMVHVEGTRSFDCTSPVSVMSGKFVDLALEANVPIVPVRFSGGLPRTALQTRTEFPIGMGRQDIWLGRPMLPAELAPMPYGDRKNAVLKAINALGPSADLEQPLLPDPEFADRVHTWQQTAGCSEEHAGLWVCLQDVDSPSEPIARLLKAAETGTLELSSSAEDQWLGTVAQWVFGTRGPTIVRPD